MAYATRSDLDSLTSGKVNLRLSRRLVDRCMAKADAIINARLGLLYGVPFAAPYPALVVDIAESLSLYYIYTSAAWAGVRGNTEEVRKDLWQNAMDLLDKIIDGDVVLIDVTLPASAGNGTRTNKITSTTEEWQPVFDLDDTIEWEVDPDQLDDIDSRRG